MRLEDGTVHGGVQQVDNFTPPFNLDGRWVGEASFVLPTDLPLGYHRLHLRSRGIETSAALIVTPDWLGLPEQLGARRAWGLAAQLYSVRSEQSWGVGDLIDLTDLAVWSATRHGADYLLVNPLHAATPTLPMEPSPYLPTSRRFFNPLYLRVESIPEFAGLAKRGRVRRLRDDVQQRAGKLDAIDRDSAWTAKREALRLVYRAPRSAGRELAYAAFREGKAKRSTTSPSGARWPKSMAATGTAGPTSCSIPPRSVSPGSPQSTRRQWISIAGCNGNSTSNSPRPSHRRSRRACRWGSCTIWRSGCTRTGPTPGRCRMCWRWE